MYVSPSAQWVVTFHSLMIRQPGALSKDQIMDKHNVLSKTLFQSGICSFSQQAKILVGAGLRVLLF
jgi:hypothetical protein